MPGFDRTGPLGTGPVGRGMGPCKDGFTGRSRGRGFGRAGRAGWGMIQAAPLINEDKDTLEQQKNWLETQLAQIKQKLQGMD